MRSRAGGRKHEHRHVCAPREEKAKEAARRGVGPVQVVQNEQKPPTAGGTLQRLHERVVEPQAPCLCVGSLA